MRTALLGAIGALCLPFAPMAAAQKPPATSPAVQATAPAMFATERFLFVIRGDVLWQFDVQTLAVVHTFAFPGGPPPAAGPVAAPVGAATAPAEPPAVPAGPPATGAGASVEAALRWLAAHQDENGRWDADGFMKHDRAGEPCDGPGNAVHDVGVTGLALLAFLGGGNTMRKGPYRDNVRRAAQWLREQQNPDTGLFGTNASHDFVYDHAIAAFAMSEAYGLSEAKALKAVAQKGVDYLESHRNPFAVWRYQPRDNDNDTSVTTWAVAACKSAQSFGLEVDEVACKAAATWYDQVTAPDGRAGYTKQGEPSSRHPGDHATRFPVELGEAMTAAALYGRFLLGQDPKDQPVMMASATRLLASLPRWEKDRVDAVYWYFGTFAMFQMGGRHWETWRRAIAALADHQRQDGNFAGSWDPIGVWDEDGGRVFVTALYALSLEAYQRHAILVK